MKEGTPRPPSRTFNYLVCFNLSDITSDGGRAPHPRRCLRGRSSKLIKTISQPPRDSAAVLLSMKIYEIRY